MIPYPGESLGAFDAADGSDHSLALDVIYRGSFYGTTPGTATLAAGDVWRAWVASGTADYLEEDGLDLDVSWVVEVVSGTVTFTAGEANDPDYGDDTLAPTSTLGTYTVTGPATVAIPSGFTGTQVYNDAGDDICFMLHLAASSGSAVVQQVKLRVWPQGGAVGAWSGTLDGFDTDPQAPGVLATSVTVNGGSTAVAGAEAAWDAAVDDFHANATSINASQSRTLGTGAPIGPSASQGLSNVGDGNYSASTDVTSVLFLLTGANPDGQFPIGPGLTEGVDWIRPPEEVAGDQAHYAEQFGSPSVGWSDASLYFQTNPSGGGVPGGFTVDAEAGTWADESGTAGYQVTLPVAVGGPVVEGQNALPTSGQMIRVSLAHEAFSGSADEWPGATPAILTPYSRSEGSTRYFGTYPDAPIRTFVSMPPYRVWDPAAVEEILPRVRQLHRDDGQGMTPPRHFGGASRAATGRHFGYD